MAQHAEQPRAAIHDDPIFDAAYVQSWLDNAVQSPLPMDGNQNAVILSQTPRRVHQSAQPTAPPFSTLILPRSPIDRSFMASKLAANQKHHPTPHTPSPPLSDCSNQENIPPVGKFLFEKRRRHKTREDRYDTRHRKKSKDHGRPLSRQQRREKKRKVLKSRKEVVKNFSSTAIAGQQVIVCTS